MSEVAFLEPIEDKINSDQEADDGPKDNEGSNDPKI